MYNTLRVALTRNVVLHGFSINDARFVRCATQHGMDGRRPQRKDAWNGIEFRIGGGGEKRERETVKACEYESKGRHG